jgi:hypothetical protein
VAAEATEGAIRTAALAQRMYRGKCSIDCGFLDVGGCKPCSFLGKMVALASAEVGTGQSKLFLAVPNLVTIRCDLRSSRDPDALLAYSHANHH